MSRSNRTADPFGTALIDVLTNSFNAIVLLFLIVGTSIRGGDYKDINLPPEDAKGEIYTVLDFERQIDIPVPELLLIQIDLGNVASGLTIEKKQQKANKVSISKRLGEGTGGEWLISRQGSRKGKRWSIRLTNPKKVPSISVYITHKQRVQCAQRMPVNGRSTVIEVIERGPHLPPIIRVLGRTDCNY